MLVRTFLIKLGIVYDDKGAKDAEKDVDGLGKTAERAKRPVDKLGDELDDAAKSAKKAGTATAKAGKQIKTAGTQADKTTRQVGKLDQLMGKLSASIAEFGPQIAAAGVAGLIAGVGQAIAFVGEETARLDGILKGAAKAGFAVDSFQTLAHVATLSGTEVDVLAKGISNLEIQLDVMARGGAGPAAEALDELGLKLEDLEGQDPTQQLATISRALESIDGPADKSRVAFKLLGEEGRQLIPLFNSGADAIDEMSASVGKIFSEEELGRAAAYQDALANLDKTIGAVKGSVALALAPAMQRSAELFEEAIPGMRALFEGLAGDIVPAFERLAEAAAPWIERLAPLLKAGLVAAWLPLKAIVVLVEVSTTAFAALLEVGETVLGWIVRFGDYLGDEFPRAADLAGRVFEALSSPLETVRDLANEVLDAIEGIVGGVGSLGGAVRSARAAISGGGVAAAAGAAAAGAGTSTGPSGGGALSGLVAGARGAFRSSAKSAASSANSSASAAAGAAIAAAFEATRPRAPRKRGGGGGGSKAAATGEVGFLESLGLNAPGSLISKRPAPNTMIINFSVQISAIENMTINITGAGSTEQRRAAEDAASQVRDAVMAKLSDIPPIFEKMIRLQAKSLQAAGSSKTLAGGG